VRRGPRWRSCTRRAWAACWWSCAVRRRGKRRTEPRLWGRRPAPRAIPRSPDAAERGEAAKPRARLAEIRRGPALELARSSQDLGPDVRTDARPDEESTRDPG